MIKKIKNILLKIMDQPKEYEYFTLLAAQNIIFGYSKKALDCDLLLITVEKIKKELERQASLGSFPKEIYIPSLDVLKNSSNIEYSIWDNIYGKNEKYHHDFKKALKLSKTNSAKEFLQWCEVNRCQFYDAKNMVFVELKIISVDSDTEITVTDLENNYIISSKHILKVKLIPNKYIIKYKNSRRNKVESIELYESKTINER